MRVLVLGLIALTTLSCYAEAQSRSRSYSRSMLFGSLLADRELQKELKLTDKQIQRMREIYIQSQPADKVIFSAWGIKELGISKGQLKQMRKVNLDHLKRMLKIRKEMREAIGGSDNLRLYLKKRQEMEKARVQAKLSVLTRSQWKRFEKLKGKPYNPFGFGKSPARPKRKPDV